MTATLKAPADERVINMLWIGQQLGPIELLSIASFVAAGHSVHLHVYDNVRNVPAEATVLDANAIVPWDDLAKLRHKKSGSYAVAADYFRMSLQRAGAGPWADLDMVCLNLVKPASPCLIGWEDGKHLNTAYLSIGRDHPIIGDLMSRFERRQVPEWVTERQGWKLRALSLLGVPISPGDLPWGSLGPKAMTYLARKYDLLRYARPADVFYPIHWRRAADIYDPAFSLDSVVTQDTLTIHLWNEALRDFRGTRPPAGSSLDKLNRRFGI